MKQGWGDSCPPGCLGLSNTLFGLVLGSVGQKVRPHLWEHLGQGCEGQEQLIWKTSGIFPLFSCYKNLISGFFPPAFLCSNWNFPEGGRLSTAAFQGTSPRFVPSSSVPVQLCSRDGAGPALPTGCPSSNKAVGSGAASCWRCDLGGRASLHPSITALPVPGDKAGAAPARGALRVSQDVW